MRERSMGIRHVSWHLGGESETNDFFSILLGYPSPLRKRRSLPHSLSLGIHDIPYKRVLDEKAAPCRSNSHTLVGIEIAARPGLLQHPFPLGSIDRLSRES